MSSAVATSTEPIRNTEAYKAISEAVAEALDDSGASRYGGYEEKEVRRKLREKRRAKAGMQIAHSQRVKEDPEYVNCNLTLCVRFHSYNVCYCGQSRIGNGIAQRRWKVR